MNKQHNFDQSIETKWREINVYICMHVNETPNPVYAQ
jgi:hypothetical protein